MDLHRCKYGHFYDGEKFSECPYCNRNGEEAQKETYSPGAVNIYDDSLDNDDRTELLIEDGEGRAEVPFEAPVKRNKTQLLYLGIASGVLMVVVAGIFIAVFHTEKIKAGDDAIASVEETVFAKNDGEVDVASVSETTIEDSNADSLVADEKEMQRMLDSIRLESGREVSAYEYDDFNADGNYEVFACIYNKDEEYNFGEYEVWSADLQTTKYVDTIDEAVSDEIETETMQYGRKKNFVVVTSYVENSNLVNVYSLSDDGQISHALSSAGTGCIVKNGKPYIREEYGWIWDTFYYLVDYELYYLNGMFYTYDAVEISIDYLRETYDFDEMMDAAKPCIENFMEEDEYYTDKGCFVLKSVWLDENDTLYLNLEAWDSVTQYSKNETVNPGDFSRPNVELLYMMFDISSPDKPLFTDIQEGKWELPGWLEIHKNEQIELLRSSLGEFADEDYIIMGDSGNTETTMTADEIKTEIEKIRGYYYTPSSLDTKRTTQLSVDGKAYSLKLYYHNGVLCFAFAFDKEEEHRLYFKDERMIRYIDENGTVYDLGNLESYGNWERAVMEIAYNIY